MKNKTLKRFAAAAMTSVMMAGLFGTSLMAEDCTPVESIGLTKIVCADNQVLAPNTSFQFAIANGPEDTSKVIYAGVTGGAVFADNKDTVFFAPGDDFTEELAIEFQTDVFSKPGVYRYTVTENAGTYDGMVYSTETYYLDLYVVNGNGGFVVDDVILYKVGASKCEKTDALTFTNNYTTNDLTLKKVISGNQADMNAAYKFSVTINGAEGEKYATNYTDQEGNAVTLEAGSTYDFTLGHNESVVIYGLSAKDTYTIIEDDAHLSDGYQTTVTGDTFDEVDGKATLQVTGSIQNDTTIAYTNTKNVTTPTGIIVTFAPYIAMLALAAAMVFLFIRRRRVEG